MHDRWRAHNLATEGCADRLMAQTNAKYGNARAETLDRIAGNAGFLRRAGSGGNDDLFRSERFDFIQRDLIVAVDLHIRAELAKIMIQVVSERIVIVDQ